MPRRHAALAAMFLTPPALAQSTNPALFVANQGNLEGSVSSFLVNADGTLTFVSRVITGTRTSISNPCPGCNPYAISISPNGRWLATNHASGNAGEQVTVYEISDEAEVAVAAVLPLAQGGLDILWLRDDLLAVPITDSSGANAIHLYDWDETTQTLSFATTTAAGSFLTSIDVHPSGQWLYANDSFANTVRVFEISGNSLALVQTLGIPVFGTQVAVTPDGRFLYAAGGISAGGSAFAGYAISAVDGSLSALPASPFDSSGASPKGFAFSPDSTRLFVSHGTDATIRSFTLDPESGLPTYTGEFFDVGLQGTLQGMATLDDRLFACDNSSAIDGIAGVYSFDIDPTGDPVPVAGAPFSTQGISPHDVVAWAGATACFADCDANGTVNTDDIDCFVAAFLAANLAGADCDANGILNLDDIECFADNFLAGCP